MQMCIWMCIIPSPTQLSLPAAGLASLLTAARHDPALRTAAREAIGSPFDAVFDHVLRRAVARGVIAPTIDIATISEIFPAMAFHYAAALGRPVDEALIRRVIDGVVLLALGVT